MGLLTGKKILICSPANDHSMAWGIAKKAHDEGAEIAMTFGSPTTEAKVRELAETIGAWVPGQYDVQDDAGMDAVFDAVAKKWGTLDGCLHAIANSDPNELKGRYADTSRANFKNTMDISVYSFVDMARRASALMKSGGSILTLSYLGGERVVPNYNVMGVAKAALESSVRYLASDLGVDGVRVNAISAGPILTRAASGVGGFRSMLKVNEMLTPLRRNMTMDDVAGAAAYFFSDLASGVTGEVQYTDCGYSTTGMMPTELKDMLLKAME